MTENKSKIAIIGCGLVGSSTAFSLLTQGVCDEILMIDINAEKAYGEVLDLQDCIEYLNRNTKIRRGTYKDCRDMDIIVITAGAPPRKGQTRLDTLPESAAIVKSIVEAIMKSGFDGIFINVSNPVDVIAHYIYKLSGFPKNQVIGTGTSLDSARLKKIIAGICHVDPRSVHAYSMGEHGDSQMVPWSLITVGGKPFYNILRDNQDMTGDIDLERLVKSTAKEGWEIFNRKGTTYYGIATSCVGIIKAVMYDQNTIIPVSTLLEGEYGEKDVFCGVPAVLNRFGVSDVLELPMTSGELTRFKESAQIIRKYTEKLNLASDL